MNCACLQQHISWQNFLWEFCCNTKIPSWKRRTASTCCNRLHDGKTFVKTYSSKRHSFTHPISQRLLLIWSIKQTVDFIAKKLHTIYLSPGTTIADDYFVTKRYTINVKHVIWSSTHHLRSKRFFVVRSCHSISNSTVVWTVKTAGLI